MLKTKRPLFVYGTLLPNQPNHYLLQETIEKMHPAMLSGGQLYDMGPYPMLVPQASAKTVGMVYTINNAYYDKVIAAVDALEGFDPNNPEESAYQRMVREVVLEDGRIVKAWVYLGDQQFVKEMQPIPSGDWLAYIKTKQHTISTWWETIDTVAGMHEKR